ncbi:DEKNAAC103979 [Brettanomyces naardenensis]|uniref:DEKNAAC103979 n=1 Tax=Brettanomyces naardenensis TaxID=13370 RepID=A0A448YPN0_BRENA|nr:DEKNAAC103979 [Brettanomyces naardenensis]
MNRAGSSTSSSANSSNSTAAYRPPCRWKGLFGVHVSETGYTENGHIGTLINNCVTVNKVSNSSYRSLVCNNDQNLYVVDILNRGDGLSPEFSVNMGVALNHASMSPDLKTIVTVGDSSRIFLMHPQENIRDITNREVLSTQSDCGFSTSWSDSGFQFSSCFQEGVNFIYDVRNLAKPMHEIFSTRRQSQNGAFRVCKYSGGTDDLLFISEHQGRVHIVDTRDFMTHQVVMLPKQLYDYDDGYYNQPIVKDYQDVCDVQGELGYLSSSRRFIAGVDVARLHNSKFFSYTAENCPKRYPVEQTTETGSSSHSEQSVYDPLIYSTYLRGMATGTVAASSSTSSSSPSPSTGQNSDSSSAESDKLRSPLTDPFYYLDSELEICGLEILGNSQYRDGRRSLVIGSEDGMIHWDIDSWKRRCFPSYELA